MNKTTAITPQDAVKYYLQNQHAIDLHVLLKDFAVSDPEGFFHFLEELTGKTATQVAASLVKNRPGKFMCFATAGQMKFKAARYVIEQLTGVSLNKINAIKRIREVWNLSLREAKDTTDLLHQELGDLGRVPNGGTYDATVSYDELSHESQACFDYIKEHF
jgi:ribosomal protein L7/L12